MQESNLFPRSRLIVSPENTGKLYPQVNVSTLLPMLPKHPTACTSSIQVYIIPTEKTLFMQGFEAQEYACHSPTLLRGSLYIRILHECMIKSITLTLRGIQKTFWPDGIPPSKRQHWETKDLTTHSWSFYQSRLCSVNVNNGADFFIESNSNMKEHDEMLSILNKSGSFQPGDYIYNFEHPLPPSTPETCDSEFGKTQYWLEATICRSGIFNSNICGKIPIEIVRTPAIENFGESDSIVITDDWKDQLRYEIVISSKSFVLDSYLPIVFRFVPLFGKPQVHMIRVYLTETWTYRYPAKNAIRSVPPRKTLLLKYKANSGQSLLSNPNNDDYLPKELEFQMYVPQKIGGSFYSKLHPDTSYKNIHVKHTIRICMRLSVPASDNSGKRQYIEACIDAVVHVLSPLAASHNTLLPAYGLAGYLPSTVPNASIQDYQNTQEIPDPIGFQHLITKQDDMGFERTVHLEANLYKPSHPHDCISPISLQRPIHMLRDPSFNPPPFDADNSPPGFNHIPPPAYEEIGSYSIGVY